MGAPRKIHLKVNRFNGEQCYACRLELNKKEGYDIEVGPFTIVTCPKCLHGLREDLLIMTNLKEQFDHLKLLGRKIR